MSLNGSEEASGPPLHPILSVAAAALGTAAMVGASVVLGAHVPLRAAITIGSVLLAAPALLALLLAGRPIRRALALRRPDGRTALLAAGLGASLWVASLGLLELQSAAWPPSPEYIEMFRRIHEALKPANAFDALLSVLAIAAAPAICEETLMRGVVLPSFRPALGANGAVFVSALLFAMVHLDAYRFAFTFAVGLALGAIRVRTGALLPCMLVHGTLNTVTFLLAPFVDDPSGPLPDPRPALGAALLLGGLLVSAVLFRPLRLVPTTVDGLGRDT